MHRPIGVDFETDLIVKGWKPPKPVGVAIQWPSKAPRYYAWGHPIRNNCTPGEGLAALKKVWDAPNPVLFHNAKFDLGVARDHCGLPVLPFHRIHDTMFIIFLLDPHARSFSLKPTAERLLGLPPEEQDAVADWLRANGVITGKQAPGAFISKAPGDLVGAYAIGDLKRTLMLFDHLHPKLDDGEKRAYTRERRLLPYLMANEQKGLRLDIERLTVDIHSAQISLARADKWLRKAFGVNLNLDADDEVAAALKTSGVVKEFAQTPTGKDSVSKKTLTVDKFADPKVFQMLGYRNRLHTVLSQSMLPWLEDAGDDGRIHTEWNQVRSGHGNATTGARTGRLSCSRFMNISKDFEGRRDGWEHPGFLKLMRLPRVREYILPEVGEQWLHRDRSQQEFRILAHFADGALLTAYQGNPKIDFHDQMQDRLREVLGEEIDRNTVKGINFGLLYGMGIARLADTLKVSEERARTLRQATRDAMPDVMELDAELKRRARHGEAIRTWGGRRYYCEPQSPTGQTYEYKMLNYLIQGSAADDTKEFTCRLHEAGLSMLVTVHDEINFSAAEVEDVDAVLREVMESVEFDVPMLTERKVGATWGTLEKK